MAYSFFFKVTFSGFLLQILSESGWFCPRTGRRVNRRMHKSFSFEILENGADDELIFEQLLTHYAVTLG